MWPTICVRMMEKKAVPKRQTKDQGSMTLFLDVKTSFPCFFILFLPVQIKMITSFASASSRECESPDMAGNRPAAWYHLAGATQIVRTAPTT